MRDESGAGGVRSMVRAFRHRNFRLYFGGQSVSLIGTWVQQIALGWTIYQLTHSSWLLGLVSFAGQLPLFIVTPFARRCCWIAGTAIGRLSSPRALSMVQALSLALVVSTHTCRSGTLSLLNVLPGLFWRSIFPRDRPSLSRWSGGSDLPNAVALNSFVINGGRMLGPAIAGFFSPR